MRMKSVTSEPSAQKVMKDLRRQTRRLQSAEEKIKIVPERLRGVRQYCRAVPSRGHCAEPLLEAGKNRLVGDPTRQWTR